jgi:rhodanese-related sulfurtransferase
VFSTIKELDVTQLKDQLDQGKTIRLIDVRSLEEMAAGMIPNAEKLPLHTLPLRLNDLSNDEHYVLYCRSGARSAQGVGFLMAQGFQNVYNLRGGIISWARMGLPLAN